jgi:hypothetical protein
MNQSTTSSPSTEQQQQHISQQQQPIYNVKSPPSPTIRMISKKQQQQQQQQISQSSSSQNLFNQMYKNTYFAGGGGGGRFSPQISPNSSPRTMINSPRRMATSSHTSFSPMIMDTQFIVKHVFKVIFSNFTSIVLKDKIQVIEPSNFYHSHETRELLALDYSSGNFYLRLKRIVERIVNDDDMNDSNSIDSSFYNLFWRMNDPVMDVAAVVYHQGKILERQYVEPCQILIENNESGDYISVLFRPPFASIFELRVLINGLEVGKFWVDAKPLRVILMNRLDQLLNSKKNNSITSNRSPVAMRNSCIIVGDHVRFCWLKSTSTNDNLLKNHSMTYSSKLPYRILLNRDISSVPDIKLIHQRDLDKYGLKLNTEYNEEQKSIQSDTMEVAKTGNIYLMTTGMKLPRAVKEGIMSVKDGTRCIIKYRAAINHSVDTTSKNTVLYRQLFYVLKEKDYISNKLIAMEKNSFPYDYAYNENVVVKSDELIDRDSHPSGKEQFYLKHVKWLDNVNPYNSSHIELSNDTSTLSFELTEICDNNSPDGIHVYLRYKTHAINVYHQNFGLMRNGVFTQLLRHQIVDCDNDDNELGSNQLVHLTYLNRIVFPVTGLYTIRICHLIPSSSTCIHTDWFNYSGVASFIPYVTYYVNVSKGALSHDLDPFYQLPHNLNQSMAEMNRIWYRIRYPEKRFFSLTPALPKTIAIQQVSPYPNPYTPIDTNQVLLGMSVYMPWSNKYKLFHQSEENANIWECELNLRKDKPDVAHAEILGLKVYAHYGNNLSEKFDPYNDPREKCNSFCMFFGVNLDWINDDNDREFVHDVLGRRGQMILEGLQ